jgi:MFS family permease
MLIGPWMVGGFVGWRWGKAWPGAVAAVALGFVLTAAGLAAFLLTAPPSAEEACGEDECVNYFGRWLEASLAREWPVYTAVTWSASAVFFSWVRRSNGRRLGKRAVASWALGLLGLAVLVLVFLIPLATAFGVVALLLLIGLVAAWRWRSAAQTPSGETRRLAPCFVVM